MISYAIGSRETWEQGYSEGSTESGFMEKQGIEPATPGLQGIALIHYTTGASLFNGNKGTDDSNGKWLNAGGVTGLYVPLPF